MTAIFIDPYLKIDKIKSNILNLHHYNYTLNIGYKDKTYEVKGNLDFDYKNLKAKGNGTIGYSFLKTSFEIVLNDKDLYLKSPFFKNGFKFNLSSINANDLKYEGHYLGQVNNLYHYNLNFLQSDKVHFQKWELDLFVDHAGEIQIINSDITQLQIDDQYLDIDLNSNVSNIDKVDIKIPTNYLFVDPQILKSIKQTFKTF